MAAYFNVNTAEGHPPLSVTFTDQSTGAITSWSWSFGDGTTSTAGNPPTHTYFTVGNYPVSLTVTGPNGTSNTFSAVIYVTAPEPVSYDQSVDNWQALATPDPTAEPTPDPTQEPANATTNAMLGVPSGPATTPEPLVGNVETLRTGLDLNLAFTALLGIGCLGYVIYLGYAMIKK